jgi:hypothetical protein
VQVQSSTRSRYVARHGGAHERSTAATRLAVRQHGLRGSVRSARGRAARGDGVLGADVGAGLRDRWSQRCTGVRARSVDRRTDAARRARNVARWREPAGFN